MSLDAPRKKSDNDGLWLTMGITPKAFRVVQRLAAMDVDVKKQKNQPTPKKPRTFGPKAQRPPPAGTKKKPPPKTTNWSQDPGRGQHCIVFFSGAPPPSAGKRPRSGRVRFYLSRLKGIGCPSESPRCQVIWVVPVRGHAQINIQKFFFNVVFHRATSRSNKQERNSASKVPTRPRP